MKEILKLPFLWLQSGMFGLEERERGKGRKGREWCERERGRDKKAKEFQDLELSL